MSASILDNLISSQVVEDAVIENAERVIHEFLPDDLSISSIFARTYLPDNVPTLEISILAKDNSLYDLTFTHDERAITLVCVTPQTNFQLNFGYQSLDNIEEAKTQSPYKIKFIVGIPSSENSLSYIVEGSNKTISALYKHALAIIRSSRKAENS